MTDELLQAAVEAARAGGRVTLDMFRRGALEVEEKSENDFVTLADRRSERAVVEALLARFPDHRIVAEEGSLEEGADGAVEWLVDPLDGTSNFIQGLPIFAVSVAARREGALLAAAILDPCGGNLFTAWRGGGAWWNGKPMRVSTRRGLRGAFVATGFPFKAKPALDMYLSIFGDVFAGARSIRRCGAAAIDLAYTAAGVYDGFFEFRLAPWDLAAGILLIREAGGVATDLDGGDEHLRTGDLLAGCPEVHRELLEVARRRGGTSRLDRLLAQGSGTPS
jgi:myo-inositol-1(or 4)-monophosphatase